MRGPYRKRMILQPPQVKSFKPSGIPQRALQNIVMQVDEYEAIRLADYLGLEHQQAADQMQISRPTFTRLIERARNKMASALIEGKALLIEGGNVDFIYPLSRCKDCGETFQPNQNQPVDRCPDCGSENIEDLTQDYLSNRPGRGGRGHGRRGR